MFNLEEGESEVQIIRRHFWVMIPITFNIIIMALAPFIFYYFFTSNFLSIDRTIINLFDNFLGNWGTFSYLVWLLLLWILFFVEWTDYYLDVLVVTNKRIVQIEQKGFFNREVTSFFYAQIQDITVETAGFIKTFLKFGHLHIQTAGHNHEIIIKDAHNPEQARSLILRLQEQAGSKSNL